MNYHESCTDNFIARMIFDSFVFENSKQTRKFRKDEKTQRRREDSKKTRRLREDAKTQRRREDSEKTRRFKRNEEKKKTWKKTTRKRAILRNNLKSLYRVQKNFIFTIWKLANRSNETIDNDVIVNFEIILLYHIRLLVFRNVLEEFQIIWWIENWKDDHEARYQLQRFSLVSSSKFQLFSFSSLDFDRDILEDEIKWKENRRAHCLCYERIIKEVSKQLEFSSIQYK